MTSDSGDKAKVQKHVMIHTISDAYKMYQQQHPGRKVGLTTFKKFKPPQVRKISETNRRTCLCTSCCNVALKIDSLKKVMSAADVETVMCSKETLSALTLCSDPPRLQCLNRTCDACGTNAVVDHFRPITDVHKDRLVTWHKWEYVTISKKDQIKRCISCVVRETSLEDLVTELASDMSQYSAHIYRASWQIQQMTECLNGLQHGEVMAVMDFAENYGCRYQNEVQSAYFDQVQVTLHPIMAYYMAPQNDGTFMKVKHAIVGITADVKHDVSAVMHFEEEALKLISKHTDVAKIFQWTDGCAAQYKGRSSFASISLRQIPIQRNFFETSHGKSVCDGLGAVIKNYCHQAVVSGKAILGSAQDVFKFVSSHLVHGPKLMTVGGKEHISIRDFVFVSDVNRDRPELDVATLKGTRNLHAIKNVSRNPYVIQIRNISCYCQRCKVGQEGCINPNVEQWKEVQLALKQAQDASASNSENKTCILSICSYIFSELYTFHMYILIYSQENLIPYYLSHSNIQ